MSVSLAVNVSLLTLAVVALTVASLGQGSDGQTALTVSPDLYLDNTSCAYAVT